jgi:hypothetical protein
MGKRKYIETPERMWQLFEEYRKEVKGNPRHVYEYHGKDGEQRLKPLERPLTMEGFSCFCYDKVGSVHQYFANQDKAYTEYLNICSRIKEEIRRDQIEGGMVGQYNPSITQRLNGLVDKRENDNKGSIEIFKGIDLSVKEDNSTE